MEELLLCCTTEVYFTCNKDIYYIDIDNAVSELNNFHHALNFTYELEKNNGIQFLDVKLMRDNEDTISTTIDREPTNNDTYMHLNS